ncbi:hypothetical protein L227DRAFT_608283 [Lentinus tigrinus ALCF2SS1-6]|uniref:DUF6534 domain-containing protein n=1 Tax=Lentinus tigrinus ALCF2SS1-6 TaxID=1328759 RepID=A0A5C2SKP1_9APHY|nr:hypothetical protein L227DRAFT_608283 [Lentinus tigrinus ALCF2SS1-6]
MALTSISARAEIPSTTSSVSIAVASYLVLILYGQSFQGGYQYFRRYPKDGYDLKIIIAALLLFDTIHMVCNAHLCYVSLTHASGSSAGETFTSFVFSLWSFWVGVATSGCMLSISQWFFARRVYKLGKQPVAFNALMVTLTFLWLGNAIAYTAICLSTNAPNPLTLIEQVVIFGVLLLSDIALTWRLVAHLRNSRTGFRSTDTLLNKLIHFSLNTGILTALLTLVSMILLVVSPLNFVYLPVTIILAPVHANIVLCALNSRRSLVDRGSEGIELRSFDLDVAPRQEGNSETIQFATPSGVVSSVTPQGEEVSASGCAGATQSIRIQLAPLEAEAFGWAMYQYKLDVVAV